jgi:AcrR family transcriptional regulator
MMFSVTERRQRLLDALVTIVAEHGLDRVSIREVAAAADVSIGTVQYYCRTKDEMLLMAWEYVAGNIIDRTGTARAETVRDTIRQDLLQLLPLDEPRTIESRVYLAFAARAAVSAPLAEVQHNLLAKLRGHLAQGFQRAKDTGEAPKDLDPHAAAATTAALVDGLLLHLLTDPAGLSPQAAVAALDTHLDRYLAAPGKRR